MEHVVYVREQVLSSVKHVYIPNNKFYSLWNNFHLYIQLLKCGVKIMIYKVCMYVYIYKYIYIYIYIYMVLVVVVAAEGRPENIGHE